LVDRGKKGGTAGQLRSAALAIQHNEFSEHDSAPAFSARACLPSVTGVTFTPGRKIEPDTRACARTGV